MAYDGPQVTAPREFSPGDVSTTSSVAIDGGRIVTPSGTIEGGTVVLDGDRIDRVRPGPAPRAETVIDAHDRVVMPGIIDVHGDDFEHQLVPRAGASIDPRTAFVAADRLNLTHGITTKLHAVAFEEEGTGHRSRQAAHRLVRSLLGMSGLVGTNLIHARFERHALDIELAEQVLTQDAVVLASLMHHVPGEGEYADADDFMERYIGDADMPCERAEAIGEARTNTSSEWAGPARQLVQSAHDHGVPVASHDEANADGVERAAAHGVDICEFPLTREAIGRAADLGLHTVMGAPNLVRGESLFENLDADTAVAEDVLDMLCADYHPPSLLQAAFVETGEPLHRRLARMTVTPAEVLGLRDRGRLTAGARADLVIVDPDPIPRVTDVIVGGRSVLDQTDDRP